MAQTRFTEGTLPKLNRGDWIDPRYPNLIFRVGQKTRTWMLRMPRRADGSRPGAKLGRYPDLGRDSAVKKYRSELGRLARGEAPPDIEQRIRELEGELRALKRIAGKLVTLRDLGERFLDQYVPRSGVPLTDEVWRSYQSQLQRRVYPKWGDADAQHIDAMELQEHLNEIAKETPIAANCLLKLLKTIYGWGMRKKLVSCNPLLDVDKPSPDRKRERSLSPKELVEVWNVISEIPTVHGDVLKLGILTWARRKEVAEIPWSELHEEGWWHLSDQRAAKKSRSELKSNLIYLGPLAQEIIERQRARSSDSQFVFRGYRKRDQPIDRSRLTTLIVEISKRLVAEGRISAPFVLHDLRRTGATLAREKGADRRVVKRILNHSSSDVTDIYDLYEMKPEIQETMTLWNDFLANELGLTA